MRVQNEKGVEGENRASLPLADIHALLTINSNHPPPRDAAAISGTSTPKRRLRRRKHGGTKIPANAVEAADAARHNRQRIDSEHLDEDRYESLYKRHFSSSSPSSSDEEVEEEEEEEEEGGEGGSVKKEEEEEAKEDSVDATNESGDR